MKPLLKWPGGKGREIDQVYGLIPDHRRYLEPFFGGGALFFHLQPKRAAINDTAKDLMEFYHMVRTQNSEFKACLTCYADSFQGILDFGRMHATDLLDCFELVSQDPEAAKAQLSDLMDSWTPAILSLFHQHLVTDEDAFRKELEADLWDKLVRTVKNHAKTPFSPDDLVENLVTGLASGS